MQKEFKISKIGKWNLVQLNQVCKILYRAGKDMASRYELHHWDNCYLKDMAVVGLCALKNDIYLVYSNGQPVATFQTVCRNSSLNFQKLATLPEYMGEGIGSFCMTAIEKMAADRNCEAVTCEVYDKSLHAKEFYIHKGYRCVGETQTLKYTELKLKKAIKGLKI